MLAVLTVNVDDDGAIAVNDGDLTLREAIAYVNQDAEPETGDLAHIDLTEPFGTNDTIRFASSLNGGTIMLTPGQFGEPRELSITEAVTIDASMLSAGITIEAYDPTPDQDNMDGSRIFLISVVQGELEITEVALKNLTLTGGDVSGGGGAIRFFSTNYAGSTGYSILSLEDCTLYDNHGHHGGGIEATYGVLELTRTIIADNRAYGNGGAVNLYDVRSATIADSQLLRNETDYDGGGLWGSLNLAGNTYITLVDSLVAENKAIHNIEPETGVGGGLYVDLHGLYSTATLNVINTTLIDNEAAKDGGGAYIESKFPSELNVFNSTIARNSAGFQPAFGDPFGRGGGLWISNDPYVVTGLLSANIEQTTISDNSALVEGGGVWLGMILDEGYDDGQLETELDFVTITDNHAPDGGGLFSQVDSRVSTTLRNTIVSGNTKLANSNPDNVSGEVENSSSFNLLGSGGMATLPPTTTPQFNIHSDSHGLLGLADNGGPRLPNGDPMLTHKPTPTSEAVDAGDPNFTPPPATDQRGSNFVRVYDQPVTKLNRGPVDIGAIELGAVRVVNVSISGSGSTHDEFLFNDPSNDNADFDGSGIQLRTVPVGGADTVSIQFSDAMPTTGAGAIGGGSLTLTGLAVGTTPTLASGGFNYDIPTQTASWRFAAPLPADQYLISLTDAVKDSGGNSLDGEWTNPFSRLTTNALVSEFPSGDGGEGGDFNFVFTILPGDANLNNVLDGSDYLIWQLNIGGPGRSFTQADYDGDGDVDGADNNLADAYSGPDLHDLILADFNNDGGVDSDDYDIWDANVGDSNATHAEGDADGDGDVDEDDEVIYNRQFWVVLLDWVA